MKIARKIISEINPDNAKVCNSKIKRQLSFKFNFLRFFEIVCGCDSNGSTTLQCNANGKCNCQVGYSGDKCNQCAADYFGYPTCKGIINLSFNLAI